MAEVLAWPRHLRQRCTRERCEACARGTCVLSVLFVCATCGGAEGDLPTDCPGQRMPSRLQHEVYAGRANFLRHHGWVTEGDLQFRSNS